MDRKHDKLRELWTKAVMAIQEFEDELAYIFGDKARHSVINENAELRDGDTIDEVVERIFTIQDLYELVDDLKEQIRIFEEQEEYEKCILLKKQVIRTLNTIANLENKKK